MTSPDRVTYVGHATVLIELEGKRLITDPVLRAHLGPLRRQASTPPGEVAENLDAVLISHLHRDHADIPSLRRIGWDVPVMAPMGAGRFLTRCGFSKVSELAPGDVAGVGGVTVTAVEADHGGREIGRRHSGALGFLIEASRCIYFAGDTDLFDGMGEIGPGLDLALLPIWGWGPSLGPGHLDPERAARAAAMLSARVVIPIHWGTLFPVGLRHLAGDRLSAPPAEFADWARRLAPQVEVRILGPGEATSLA